LSANGSQATADPKTAKMKMLDAANNVAHPKKGRGERMADWLNMITMHSFRNKNRPHACY